MATPTPAERLAACEELLRMANTAADSHLDEVRAQAQRIVELEADQWELVVLRRDMGAVQAERDSYAEEAGRARDQLARLEAERDELNARIDAADEAFKSMAQTHGGIHPADALMHVTRIMSSLRGHETPSRLAYDRLHQQMRAAQDELAKVREEAEEDAAIVAYQLDHLDEQLNNEREHALEQAVDTVLERQMRDAARMAGTDLDSGSCGAWCGHGKTCHDSEAMAALERVLSGLRALASGGSSVTKELATARAERDRLGGQIAELLKRTEGWLQESRYHGEYSNRTGSRYEHGKAVIYDELTRQVREVLGGGEGK